MAKRSRVGAQTVFAPGEWSVTHTPAADTAATATKAAAAGVKHVLTSLDATLIGLAAAVEATVLVHVRDGASGAGTILRSFRLLVKPSGEVGIALSGLNLVGTEGNAMTIEFATEAGSDTFETVGMSGFSIETDRD